MSFYTKPSREVQIEKNVVIFSVYTSSQTGRALFVDRFKFVASTML